MDEKKKAEKIAKDVAKKIKGSESGLAYNCDSIFKCSKEYNCEQSHSCSGIYNKSAKSMEKSNYSCARYDCDASSYSCTSGTFKCGGSFTCPNKFSG